MVVPDLDGEDDAKPFVGGRWVAPEARLRRSTFLSTLSAIPGLAAQGESS